MPQEPGDFITRADLREEIQTSENRILDRLGKVVETMRDIETNMHTEFHRYARGQHSRMHTLESTDNDMKIRMGALEERVLELESRIRPKYDL